MLLRPKVFFRPVELQQHILGHIVSVLPAAGIAVGHAKDRVHPLLRGQGKAFIGHSYAPIPFLS